MGEEDKKWIHNIRYGKPQAFNEAVNMLLEKSRPIVIQVVAVGGGGEEDVEYILNDTAIDLIAIIQNGKFDPDIASWKTLVYSIAKHKWIDRRKQNDKFNYRFPRLSSAMQFFPFSIKNSIEENLFTKDKKNRIALAIKLMDPKCKELMVMKYVKGLLIITISERLGITESAAKQRHKRCKEKLKRIFGIDPRID